MPPSGQRRPHRHRRRSGLLVVAVTLAGLTSMVGCSDDGGEITVFRPGTTQLGADGSAGTAPSGSAAPADGSTPSPGDAPSDPTSPDTTSGDTTSGDVSTPDAGSPPLAATPDPEACNRMSTAFSQIAAQAAGMNDDGADDAVQQMKAVLPAELHDDLDNVLDASRTGDMALATTAMQSISGYVAAVCGRG